MEALTCQDLLGKILLIGITYYTKDDKFIEQKQLWGTVTQANENGIVIRQKDGNIFSLPPDLRSTKPAPKGEYRLRSTGEVVVDPDYISVWIIHRDPDDR